MLYDDTIHIDENRIRDRFDYNQNMLCFKNIETSADAENKAPIRIQVENISYSGLGLQCSRPVNVGSLLIFNMINGDETREMMLEVRWISKKSGHHYAGCEFMALTKEDIYFIHGIIGKIKTDISSI